MDRIFHWWLRRWDLRNLMRYPETTPPLPGLLAWYIERRSRPRSPVPSIWQ